MTRSCGSVSVVEPTTQDDVSIQNCGVSPGEVRVGQDVTISGTINNNGETAADVEIGLKANGSVIKTVSETIPAGNGVSAEFTTAPSSDTNYSITIQSVAAV